jgi:hypothetical protein
MNGAVYPADSKILGLSYKELAEKYWQWWIAQPRTKSDPTSSYSDSMKGGCFLGNDSSVIFLANPIITQTLLPGKHYDCTIPHGKPIVVMGISELCNYNAPREDNPNQKIATDAELESCVHVRNPYAEVIVTVDNESIKIPSEKRENNQSKFSFTSDFFNITIPKGSIHDDWGVGTNRALLDSKLVILKPLPVGDHNIGIKTVQLIPERPLDNLFLGLTYAMHVK